MFQESEIINLVFAFAAVIIITISNSRVRIPQKKYFYQGLFFMFLGYIFTVIEGVYWPQIFNFLEHFAYALSGLSFAVGCWLINSHSTQSEQKQ